MRRRWWNRLAVSQWVWLALVLALIGCSRPSSPEAEVRAMVAKAVTAAEAHNVRDLRGMIADDYRDQRGLDRKAVENLLRLQVLRQQSLYLFARISNIEFPTPERALTSVAVAMAGKPIQDASSLTGLNADLYRFDLEWVRYGQDDWRVQTADWKPARLDDFW